jgi:hypothetical protein
LDPGWTEGTSLFRWTLRSCWAGWPAARSVDQKLPSAISPFRSHLSFREHLAEVMVLLGVAHIQF